VVAFRINVRYNLGILARGLRLDPDGDEGEKRLANGRK
jgi:hypothetical protein